MRGPRPAPPSDKGASSRTCSRLGQLATTSETEEPPPLLSADQTLKWTTFMGKTRNGIVKQLKNKKLYSMEAEAAEVKLIHLMLELGTEENARCRDEIERQLIDAYTELLDMCEAVDEEKEKKLARMWRAFPYVPVRPMDNNVSDDEEEDVRSMKVRSSPRPA